jgi:subtilisin family serine protease
MAITEGRRARHQAPGVAGFIPTSARGGVVSAILVAVFSTGVVTALAPMASAEPDSKSAETAYVVLFKKSGPDAAAERAIRQAGGRIVSVNTKIGYAYATSRNSTFRTAVAATGAVAGAAAERVIGRAPQIHRPASSEIERLTKEAKGLKAKAGLADAPAAKQSTSAAIAPEPLANLQWDMRMIGATPTGSYPLNQGKGVRVGIIDTGIDGSHPDIAPNFNKALSRNFVTDMPDIDGPCEVSSCKDPVDVDDDGHGTHVASTIGSPINALGIAGVAPKATLINIRAGQDSGFFFLKATLDALTYAGDIGVDVVNMSYFTDPWLFNCLDNPADSPEEQAEQRVIRQTTQRALNYALHHDVLPVAAMGNESTNLNHPTVDSTSPDYPPDAAKDRTIDNSCITVPTESRGVVGVTALGPSKRLSYYSNYGTEQADVSAPGGDAYDSPDNTLNYANLVLAAYPQALAELNGELNPDGTPNVPYVVRDCKGAVCAYYQYLQGTSMAAPHAVGVAALVVGRLGKPDALHPGKRLDVDRTRRELYQTATDQACPQPRTYHYTRIRPTGEVVESDAYCAGPPNKNGFYGRGIVNAYLAAGGSRANDRERPPD